MKLFSFIILTLICNGTFCQLNCNNWLNTPNNGSFVTVGDVDISGNQLTIEANFNRTFPLNSGVFPGHLVSKHTDNTNSNYSLFPNGCALNTSNGYFSTFENCSFLLNKTYHVAMVYDGSFLKFYRNGFLLSQTACTGNLITNNLPTTIAQISSSGSPSNNQFLGYANEVRIWNVARTQAEIRQYMNSTLPNPTTQTGLQAYYTFDNLNNKQGNASYNGTLNGSAIMNQTNPNCTFVADSCEIIPQNLSCNNWLNVPNYGSYVTIGDLDITGDQITVEAFLNSTDLGTNNSKPGHLVSKHSNEFDVNYSLMLAACEITTTGSGYIALGQPCNAVIGKTYHVAMTYDGTKLKFYRNGFLINSAPCTGNLINNNWITTIGQIAHPSHPFNNQVNGYINEVRIWNVARTQADIRQYMNSSLPNPTTQTGLQAYYTFDNLNNKQGNSSFNGTLNGSASINQINPNCSYVADSCGLFALPNNLEIFKGQLVNGKVQLYWKMDDLTYLKNFEIQESLNGRDFYSIQIVNLSSSFDMNWFQFKILTELNSKKFYRLKINDKSEQYSFSKILSFDKLGETNGVKLSFYPNPVNKNIKVIFSSLKESKGRILFYSIENGKKIFSKEIFIKEGINSLDLNMEYFSKGVYNVVIYNSWELLDKGIVIKQ